MILYNVIFTMYNALCHILLSVDLNRLKMNKKKMAKTIGEKMGVCARLTNFTVIHNIIGIGI